MHSEALPARREFFKLMTGASRMGSLLPVIGTALVPKDGSKMLRFAMVTNTSSISASPIR
jgi:hypothetical protein